MKKTSSVISLVLIVLLAVPQAAFAQITTGTPQGTWDGLKAIPPGDELVIDLKTGKTIKGRITGATDTALALIREKKTTTVNRADALRVYRLMPRSAKKATMIGLGVGLGGGAIAGGVYSSGGSESGEYWPVLALGGIAAGVGALIGYLVSIPKRRVLIYEDK